MTRCGKELAADVNYVLLLVCADIKNIYFPTVD